MRSSSTPAKLTRLASGLLAGFALLASPAIAGDRALANFIGFSPDARYFAFEEFGVESDSGLAYSNFHILDLDADSVKESARISSIAEEGENSGELAMVRIEAAAKAKSLLAGRNIAAPAEIAALNGDGETVPDPTRVSFTYPIPAWGVVTRTYSLQVATFPMQSSADCDADTNGEPKGYELRISNGVAETVLHRDEGVLPVSRGCPQSYELYAIVIPGVGSTKEKAVAIISYYPGSYERPSRRFLAAPFIP